MELVGPGKHGSSKNEPESIRKGLTSEVQSKPELPVAKRRKHVDQGSLATQQLDPSPALEVEQTGVVTFQLVR